MQDIDKMINEVGTDVSGKWMSRDKVHELVKHIQLQHQLANRDLSHELLGVIIDTTEGDGFDDICLATVKRVYSDLSGDTE
jgi:hypothetical protein